MPKFRCAMEDIHGWTCNAEATHVIHVDEPTTYDGTTGLPVGDQRFIQQYGACTEHVSRMSEVPSGEVQRFYNPLFVEVVAWNKHTCDLGPIHPILATNRGTCPACPAEGYNEPRPLLEVLDEYMAGLRARREAVEPGAGRSALTGEECC